MTRKVSLSVVIPTYNMATFLDALWESLTHVGLVDLADEIVFVNDASTDETLALLQKLTEISSKARVVNLEKNMGRFEARKQGAQKCQGSHILFVDSRVVLADDFSVVLKKLMESWDAIVGTVLIDTSRSVFSLYWERSHRRIFWRHYRAAKEPIVLTEENYDRYLKGTTLFYCERTVFLESCKRFEGQTVLNDDTVLMREIVEKIPIVIHPDLKIQWVPRETAGAFLLRLFERGPSFVEYHVFQTRGTFFWVVWLSLFLLMAYLLLLACQPLIALLLAGFGFFVLFLSTALFSHNIMEFIRMAPLHVAVIISFGSAIIFGLIVNLIRILRNDFPSIRRKAKG